MPDSMVPGHTVLAFRREGALSSAIAIQLALALGGSCSTMIRTDFHPNDCFSTLGTRFSRRERDPCLHPFGGIDTLANEETMDVQTFSLLDFCLSRSTMVDRRGVFDFLSHGFVCSATCQTLLL